MLRISEQTLDREEGFVLALHTSTRCLTL